MQNEQYSLITLQILCKLLFVEKTALTYARYAVIKIINYDLQHLNFNSNDKLHHKLNQCIFIKFSIMFLCIIYLLKNVIHRNTTPLDRA